MKITVAILFAAVIVAVAFAQKKVSVDAPPPKGQKVPPPLGRHKRATCGTPTNLKASEATQSVAAHNLFRGLEPASNMQKLEWSDEMAAVAKGWADKCKWEHGDLYDCSNNRLGQNLFVEASDAGYPTFNITYVAEAWNNERYDWIKSSKSCKAGKICGHWTQLVHAKSTKVGCAYNLCPTMTVAGEVWKNALYVVCDYTPPGNIIGEDFYIEGASCSNCDSDNTGKGYKCEKNLCVPCTPSTDATCKCGTAVACQNGGVWSASTCSCQCPKTHYGSACEKSCSCGDNDENCAYYEPYCTNPDYSDFMHESCMKTCGYKCDLPASCTA